MSTTTNLLAKYQIEDGIGSDTMAGPFLHKGWLRRFHLSVNAKTVQKFLDRYVNEKLPPSLQYQFRRARDGEDEVHLVITYYFKSEAENKVTITSRTSLFQIPVTQIQSGKDDCEGCFDVYAYGSNLFNVTTSNEVRGMLMERADMWSPNDLWVEHLNKSTPSKKVFSLNTTVIKDLKDGAPTTETLFEVENIGRNAEPTTFTLQPWHAFTLKQFPHAKYATRACYQAIVDTVVTPKKIDSCNHYGAVSQIKFYKYGSHPIIDNLGIKKAKNLSDHYMLQPTNYLVCLGTLREELGSVVAFRHELSNVKDSQSGWNFL